MFRTTLKAFAILGGLLAVAPSPAPRGGGGHPHPRHPLLLRRDLRDL